MEWELETTAENAGQWLESSLIRALYPDTDDGPIRMAGNSGYDRRWGGSLFSRFEVIFFIALTLEQVHLVENENLIVLLKQRPHFLSLPFDMTLSAIKLKIATKFKIIHQKNFMGV